MCEMIPSCTIQLTWEGGREHIQREIRRGGGIIRGKEGGREGGIMQGREGDHLHLTDQHVALNTAPLSAEAHQL